MSTPRYVPILKGRQGELDALREVGLSSRTAMLPLLEVAPKDETEDAATVLRICQQTVQKLATRYLHPIMLDGGLFDLDAVIDGGRGVVAVLADAARSSGLSAQPVLRLGDPSRAVREARAAHAQDGRGITFRLSGEDLDEDPDDLDDLFDTLLHEAGVDRSSVDLLLDVGAVDGDVAVLGGARMVTSLIRDLPSIQDWRSVTVASGAFPVDLSQFTANVVGERLRFDAQLFDRVASRRLPRRPDYGDYAVAHPVLAIGNAFSPPPQLRYTAAGHWLILKGRKTDPTGNAQFQRICGIIASHPDFTGTPTGNADRRIAAGSPEGPGNGTTWRMIGTTHHLDYVALRLTTLGEP
jgi:hypothetical protein